MAEAPPQPANSWAEIKQKVCCVRYQVLIFGLQIVKFEVCLARIVSYQLGFPDSLVSSLLGFLSVGFLVRWVSCKVGFPSDGFLASWVSSLLGHQIVGFQVVWILEILCFHIVGCPVSLGFLLVEFLDS